MEQCNGVVHTGIALDLILTHLVTWASDAAPAMMIAARPSMRRPRYKASVVLQGWRSATGGQRSSLRWHRSSKAQYRNGSPSCEFWPRYLQHSIG
jgi:hypothetical protein